MSIEQLLAILSDHWGEISDCEQIAQVPEDKLVTMSDSLSLFMINEQMSKLIIF